MKTRIVKHYKGGRYLILDDDVIESTNARVGNVVVVYFSLEKATWHTRDYNEFYQTVQWPDDRLRPRFVDDVCA